jgi:hypothetical protein
MKKSLVMAGALGILATTTLAIFLYCMEPFSPVILTTEGSYVRCRPVQEKCFHEALQDVLAQKRQFHLPFMGRVWVLKDVNERFAMCAIYTAEAFSEASVIDPKFDETAYTDERQWGECLFSAVDTNATTAPPAKP